MKHKFIIEEVISIHENEINIKIYGGDMKTIQSSQIKSWFCQYKKCYIERGQMISCEVNKGSLFNVEFVPEFYLIKSGEKPYILKDHFTN